MKNILIIGIGRAGKTTLSKMIKDKYNNYNLIHSDALKWAIIRAENKEKYYRENIDKQNEFEYGEYFQKTLLEMYNSLIRKDKEQYGYILESGQLHPKYVKEMIDFNNTIVICLGLGNLTINEIVDLCIEHDTEEDWTYKLSRKDLTEYAKDWYKFNEVLKEECKKYQIPYIDTSTDREKVLKDTLEKIEI